MSRTRENAIFMIVDIREAVFRHEAVLLAVKPMLMNQQSYIKHFKTECLDQLMKVVIRGLQEPNPVFPLGAMIQCFSRRLYRP